MAKISSIQAKNPKIGENSIENVDKILEVEDECKQPVKRLEICNGNIAKADLRVSKLQRWEEVFWTGCCLKICQIFFWKK